MQYVSSAERLAIEEKREEGLRKGMAQAFRNTTVVALEVRFEVADAGIATRLESITDVDVLKTIHRRALTANSLEEFVGYLDAQREEDKPYNQPMRYLEKLRAAQDENNSWLCVGLDPDPARLRVDALKWDEPVLPFNKAIIDATADLVCAYKPNLGFYLQWGAAGVIALERTIAYVPDSIPVILDCKAGDIGHTQAAWAAGLFDEWGVDAVTVNPYVGEEAVTPMVGTRPGKAVYILARTSNPSATQFQGDLRQGARRDAALTAQVLRQSQTWDVQGTVGYVVGATYPEEMALARELAPNAPFLIPGIGAQGGNLAAAVQHGPDPVAGPVISSSRSILYASTGLDFANAARAAAQSLRDQINEARGA